VALLELVVVCGAAESSVFFLALRRILVYKAMQYSLTCLEIDAMSVLETVPLQMSIATN
jgi:hypothetical protein